MPRPFDYALVKACCSRRCGRPLPSSPLSSASTSLRFHCSSLFSPNKGPGGVSVRLLLLDLQVYLLSVDKIKSLRFGRVLEVEVSMVGLEVKGLKVKAT